MAEEPFIVAFNIQDAGAGFRIPPKGEISGAEDEAVTPPWGDETTVGMTEADTNGLLKQGIRSGVATCNLVELTSDTAAHAVEAVRFYYGPKASATGARAVIKPNTNFKLIE